MTTTTQLATTILDVPEGAEGAEGAVNAPTRLLGWHFLAADYRTGHGRLGPLKAGDVLRVTPPLIFCENGLHASVRAIDALRRAPSAIVSRVELSGVILTRSTEVCAEVRHILYVHDATFVLHERACGDAEVTLLIERAAGREPHTASWHAIEVKRRWMRGEATSEELFAAWFAAWSVAESAPRPAGRPAGRFAAGFAAESAAESATESAAESVAESAAWFAAESAAESAAGSAAESAAGSAARSAAESAARSAARSAQNERLEAAFEALHTAHVAAGTV